MKSQLPNICLYTLAYPTGEKETSVHTEIELLANSCNHLNIFRLFDYDSVRAIPSNAKALNIIGNIQYHGKNLAQSLSFVTKNFKMSFLKDLRYQVNNHNRILQKAKRVEEHIRENKLEKNIHYVYWFDEWATILAMVKKNIPELRIVARAHGFDLQEHRSRVGYFPYRKMQLTAAEKVFVVSRMGAEYLREKENRFEKKVDSLYLGTQKLKANDRVPEDLHILSVSNIIPLKRVHLIAKALMNAKQKIKWTHFGEGELRNEIEDLCKKLPSNVQIDFKGHVENNKLLTFIENEAISLFINVSDSEGLPLSMMEVQSAGIPILATNVGGVREIVNKETGILVSEDITTDELEKYILNFKNNDLNKPESRKEIRQFWQNNFDIERNFQTFASQLKSIFSE